MPIISGNGDLTVKTKDINGKIQTISIPYFVKPELLKPGISDYSYEFGTQRMNLGTESNSYRGILANLDYRRGINDNLTAGYHIEAFNKDFSVGTTADYNLGKIGLISGSIGTNINQLAQAQIGNIKYFYSGKLFDFNFSFSKKLKNYKNVYMEEKEAVSENIFSASLGFEIPNNWGNIFLNFLHSKSKDKNKIAGITYQNDTFGGVRLMANINKSFYGDNKGLLAILSLTIPIKGHTIGARCSSSNKKRQYTFDISSSTNETFDYRGSFSKYSDSKDVEYDVSASKLFEKGKSTIYAFSSGNDHLQQFDYSGSIVYVDNSIFFDRTIYNSFVLVKAGGINNIPVFSNNIPVDITDKQGKALVTNIPPYAISEIRLDAEKLPINSTFATGSIKVAPRNKVGIVASFDVVKTTHAKMTLLDTNGVPLKINTSVTIEGINEDLFIGYQDILYVDDIKSLAELKGKAEQENGNTCSFSVPVIKGYDKDEVMDLGNVICK